MSIIPILDFSTDKKGIHYDYSISFMQDHHVKAILGSLQKEVRLMDVAKEKGTIDADSYKSHRENLTELIYIISEYNT